MRTEKMDRAMRMRFSIVVCAGLSAATPVIAQGFEPPVPEGFHKVHPEPEIDAETEALNRESDEQDAKFKEQLENPKVKLGYLSALHNVCKLSFDSLKLLSALRQFGLNFKTAPHDPDIGLGTRLARQFYHPADEGGRVKICSGAWQASDHLRL